jgi:hypothetical protein
MCNSKKKCKKCGEEKDLCEFSVNKKMKDGLQGQCKLCLKEKRRIKESKNPDLYPENIKKLLEENKKKCFRCGVIKSTDDFYNSPNSKIGFRPHCKSCDLNKSREYNNIKVDDYTEVKRNRQLVLLEKGLKECSICKETKSIELFYNELKHLTKKSSRCINCEKIRSQLKQPIDVIRNKKRRRHDPLYNLRVKTRSLIRTSLKNKGFSKKSRTYQILGCSYEHFKSHLENQFEPWMNWENQGLYNGTENYGWDLDHIVPISSATTEEEIIKLNHYTNFQPLCSYINRVVKKDRLDY